MAIKEKVISFPFRIGVALHLVIDLGDTGKTKSDIDLIKKSIENNALANVASGAYSLSELGENLYALTLSGASVSASNAGSNHLIVSGSGLNRCHVDFYLTTQAKDVYDDLNSKSLQVGLQSDVVNTTSIQDGAFTAIKFATDSITADALKQDAADEIGTRVWASGTRTLSSFGTLIADIWSYGTRELTSLGTSAIDSIWEYLTSNITTAGSIGKLIKDNLDVAISTIQTLSNQIKAQTDQFVFGSSGVNSEPKTPLAITSSDKDDIVDRIYDEDRTAHDTADSGGEALNDIASYVQGKRKIINSGANEEIYNPDGTLRYTFNLTKETGTDNYIERAQ